MIDEIKHYGTPRHSGRYPWGSGKDPYQRTQTFLSLYREKKDRGLSDKEIADEFGMKLSELKNRKSAAVEYEKFERNIRIQHLSEKGYTPTEIGRMLGKNESSIRTALEQINEGKYGLTKNTADVLAKTLAEKGGYLDVGSGVELEMGVTRNRLDTSIQMLKDQGYELYTIYVPQATNPMKNTTVMVLAPPGTEYKDVVTNMGKINSVKEYSPDGGATFKSVQYPASLDSKRVGIRYSEEGGLAKDGVIELRRGVDDISLGNSNYAQVRIMVDGKYYLKGMAMYSDDLPDGVDVMFNTNKKVGTPKEKVMKALKTDKDGNIDKDNPFGANLMPQGQSTYIDKNGKAQLRVINKLKEEGDWDTYSKNLSSQFLSKQSLALVKKQLNISLAEKKLEFEEINNLTNPEVKKRLLKDFADDCDSSAVKLKAAALPGQSTKVILPLTHLKEGECYCPTYKDGTQLALVRYPHAGTFEIPVVTVNNKNTRSKNILGNVRDAIGIHSKTASQLSGADFDGDTVIAIPMSGSNKISTKKAIKELAEFDPKDAYPQVPGMKIMTKTLKGREMGIVSNLITDMTVKGATEEELVRAVKHSMVVIDAEKHKLNYTQSYTDNRIDELKKKYQTGGASTIISRAKSTAYVEDRKESYKIDPDTGKKIYSYTGALNKQGKPITKKSTKMAETEDARTLLSGRNNEGTPKEIAYAEYANGLKSLGNQARKEYISTKSSVRSPEAAKKYESEVTSLNAKLELALKNTPKERQAQLLASQQIKAKKLENDDLDKEDLKKIKQQAITTARARVGASKSDVQIQISDNEWKAIQEGAISSSKLNQILNNSDIDVVRKLATPKATTKLSQAKIDLIKSRLRGGYTIADVADSLNISQSTVKQYMNE